jgi:hypothetical protein
MLNNVSKTINRILVSLVLILHVGIKAAQAYHNFKRAQSQPQIFVIFPPAPDSDDVPTFTIGVAIFVAVLAVAGFSVHSTSRCQSH